jgi:cytochrome c oxidase subunit 5a
LARAGVVPVGFCRTIRLTSLVGRYEKEFDSVQDVFELQVWRPRVVGGSAWTSTDLVQRNLNNAFAYDLVPSPSVIIAALKAARRVNDFPTAVRIFEGE